MTMGRSKQTKGATKAPSAPTANGEDPERQQLLHVEAPEPVGHVPDARPHAGGEPVANHGWEDEEDGRPESYQEKTDSCKVMLQSMVKITNLYGILLCAFFFMLGTVLIFTPSRHYANRHEASFVTHTNRSFWAVQGLILQYLTVKAAFATVYCAVLGKDPRLIRTHFIRQKTMIFLGSFVTEMGRALFYIMAGMYITPLMQVFSMMADIDDHWVWFSYYAGITSVCSGLFLIVFDVIFDCWLREPKKHDPWDDYYYNPWGPRPRPPRRRVAGSETNADDAAE